MLAALMLAFSRKTPEPQALRFASAAAGASVQRPGTLLCTEEDALSLLSSLPDAETLK
jgi:sugar/nucleoside kinase (ribokinase family)